MSMLLDIIDHIGDSSLWALDETGKQLESNNFYSWGPKGQYKNIEHNANKKGLNIIGATEITNHFRFLYDEYEKGTENSVKLSSSQVISFIDKLVEYDRKRGVNITCVILDNARIHRSHEVRKYIKKYEKRLFLISAHIFATVESPRKHVELDEKISFQFKSICYNTSSFRKSC